MSKIDQETLHCVSFFVPSLKHTPHLTLWHTGTLRADGIGIVGQRETHSLEERQRGRWFLVSAEATPGLPHSRGLSASRELPAASLLTAWSARSNAKNQGGGTAEKRDHIFLHRGAVAPLRSWTICESNANTDNSFLTSRPDPSERLVRFKGPWGHVKDRICTSTWYKRLPFYLHCALCPPIHVRACSQHLESRRLSVLSPSPSRAGHFAASSGHTTSQSGWPALRRHQPRDILTAVSQPSEPTNESSEKQRENTLNP